MDSKVKFLTIYEYGDFEDWCWPIESEDPWYVGSRITTDVDLKTLPAKFRSKILD